MRRLRLAAAAWTAFVVAACGGTTVAKDGGADAGSGDAPEDAISDAPVYCTLSGPIDATSAPDGGTVTQCSPGQICSNTGGTSDYLCCLPAPTEPHYCQ